MLRKEAKKKISGKIYVIQTKANIYYFNNSVDFLNKIKVFDKLNIAYSVNILSQNDLSDSEDTIALDMLFCLLKSQQLIPGMQKI